MSKCRAGIFPALILENGHTVARYQYDAWGNHAITDNDGNDIESGIGALNPFRYRGYYYDTETGLYYLQTRYYDPEVGRFISQDSIEYADPETINGLNLYAYCNNNPVMNIDPTGTIALSLIIGLIIGAAIGASVGGYVAGKKAYDNGARGWELFGWTALGVVGGGILGGAAGAFIGWAAPAIGSFLGSSFTLGSFALASGQTVTVSITGGQAVAGVLGLLVWFAKGDGPRMGHHQHENQMWREAMRQLHIKDKDLMQRLHRLNEKKPYANTLDKLLKNLREILDKIRR